LQSSTAGDANRENGSVCAMRIVIFYFKNLHEFVGFGANRLTKEFTTKGQKKTTLNDFL